MADLSLTVDVALETYTYPAPGEAVAVGYVGGRADPFVMRGDL
jgi:hypothetical protein